jgi:hypothetical protein
MKSAKHTICMKFGNFFIYDKKYIPSWKSVLLNKNDYYEGK